MSLAPLGDDGAPFYLWADTRGMARVLFQGGRFGGIVTSFGRPVVRHWTGIALRRGQSAEMQPAAAVKRPETFPPDADPLVAAGRPAEDLERLAQAPGLHSAAIAVDPAGWELERLSLWHKQQPACPDLPSTHWGRKC